MKKFKMPHALVIMVMIILLAVVMTWIVLLVNLRVLRMRKALKLLIPLLFSIWKVLRSAC